MVLAERPLLFTDTVNVAGVEVPVVGLTVNQLWFELALKLALVVVLEI